MPLAQRLKYSMYLAAVAGALLGLVIAVASSDAVGLLPTKTFQLIFSPAYGLVVFALAFLGTPTVSKYFATTSWESSPPDKSNAAKNFAALRQLIFVLVGLVLVFLANLFAYIWGRIQG